MDLQDSRKVTFEEGKTFSDSYGLKFFEISALTGENIDLVFETLAKEMAIAFGSLDAGN